MINSFIGRAIRCVVCCLAGVLISTGMAYAALPSPADTARITVPQAEERVLTGNIQLLAARFGVNAQTALALQASLWPNPNFAFEQNIYNPSTQRYFDFTKDGNSEVQIQQLFQLAGKREKQARLSQTGTAMAAAGFADLLRSLKLKLRTDLYDLHTMQQSIAFYDRSIASLKTTVAAAERLYQGRSILLADVLRLKSLLFTLEGEQLLLKNQTAAIQEDLHILFHDTTATRTCYVPLLSTPDHQGTARPMPSLQDAIDSSFNHSPEIRLARLSVDSAAANLSLQQALGVPDVTVGGRWSRAGSYIPNYFALSLSVDLPLFNRNQGNISAAAWTLQANRTLLEAATQQVERDVRVAWDKATETDKLLRDFDPAFAGQYQIFVDGMLSNFEKKNIRIIEFADFFESYRTSMMQFFQLQNNRLDAFETLNYIVGTDIVSPQEGFEQ